MTNYKLSSEAEEAVAVEEQMRVELGRVKVASRELISKREKLSETINRSDRDHARATAVAVRAGESTPTQTGRAELVAEVEALDRQVDALKREGQGLRRGIERHRGMNFASLAEVCEQATQDATAKESAARQAYEAWIAAAVHAEHTWNALVKDRNLTLRDPSTRISPAQTSDRPPAAKLFPGTPIRPRNIEPVEEAA